MFPRFDYANRPTQKLRRAPRSTRVESLERRQLMTINPLMAAPESPEACIAAPLPIATPASAEQIGELASVRTATPGSFGDAVDVLNASAVAAAPASADTAVFVVERDSANAVGGLIEIFDRAGAKKGAIDDPVFDTGYISDIEVGPDGNLYVGLDLASDGTGGKGVIVSFKPDGTKLGVFNLPSDPGGNRLVYPFGFDVDNQGNFWVVKPNSKMVSNVDRSGQELASAQSGANTPQDVAIGPHGPVWSNIGFLNFRPDGDFWATSTTQHATGLIDGLTFDVLAERSGNLPVDAEEDAAGNLFVTNGGAKTLQKFNAAGASQFTVATQGVPLGLAFASIATAPAKGAIAGLVWDDADGDSQHDANESGLAQWTVYVDANQNGRRDADELKAQTGADGTYTIRDVPAGDWMVAQEVPAGWEQTYPGAAGAGAASVGVASASEGITTTASPLRAAMAGRLVSTSSLDEALLQTAESGPLIRLDAMRNDPRFRDIDGHGFSTVIIDTGIDLNHPFFGPDSDGNGVADRIVYQYDFADRDADASDKIGHGSNVSSIVASSDARYPGMAPDAGIIHLKVFDDSGMAPFAAIESALQWAAEHAEEFNIASVNMSLGLYENFNQATTLPEAGLSDELAALAAKHVIVVSAAGNSFFDFGSQEGVSYPAADPNSLAVSAVWDGDNGGPFFFSSGAIDFTTGSDRITSFSQRHSELTDVFAPGALIAGAGPNGDLTNFAGTSMASPHISGIAVLAQQLAQRELGRRLTLGEFRDLLRETAHSIHDGDDEDVNVFSTDKDYPRVDVLALAEAIAGSTAEPPQADGVHRVTVRGGDTAQDVDFGSRRLDDTPDDAEKIAAYSIRLTDATGNELRRGADGRVAVSPGEELRVEVYVDDLRDFGSDGGVFAAYADLAYQNDQLDFLAGTLTHGAGFGSGKSGAVNESARLVDEAGGFQGSFTPPGADARQLVFSVRAKVKDSAAAGEQITLVLDAADQLPLHDTLLFGRDQAVSAAEIDFDSVVLEVSRPGWHNSAMPLDVNADGQVSPIDALQIVNSINSRGARQLDPAVDPVGPPFVDVNADGFVSPIDALRVINDLNAQLSTTAASTSISAAPQAGASVRVRLVATDMQGHPVEELSVGDAFQLRAYVEDLRGAPEGVFAAYLDVEYGPGATVTGPLQFSAAFVNGRTGQLDRAGQINEAGAFASFEPTGPGEHLLFTVNMRADAAGIQTFMPNAADVSPDHEILLYGLDVATPRDGIQYVGTTLSIVAPLPGDANRDGQVNLVDLNLVRNFFGAEGEGVLGDTNDDGRVDVADLNAVRNNFGASVASQATSADESARPSEETIEQPFANATMANRSTSLSGTRRPRHGRMVIAPALRVAAIDALFEGLAAAPE